MASTLSGRVCLHLCDQRLIYFGKLKASLIIEILGILITGVVTKSMSAGLSIRSFPNKRAVSAKQTISWRQHVRNLVRENPSRKSNLI